MIFVKAKLRYANLKNTCTYEDIWRDEEEKWKAKVYRKSRSEFLRENAAILNCV